MGTASSGKPKRTALSDDPQNEGPLNKGPLNEGLVNKGPRKGTPRAGTLSEVYAVHVDRRDHAGQTEVIYHEECHARAHASRRSTDAGITGATVTRYTVDVHGARMPVAWYVGGTEQRTPWPT